MVKGELILVLTSVLLWSFGCVALLYVLFIIEQDIQGREWAVKLTNASAWLTQRKPKRDTKGC